MTLTPLVGVGLVALFFIAVAAPWSMPIAHASTNITLNVDGDYAAELTAQLYMPSGSGPHPAVVVLHGCTGLDEKLDGAWAKRFEGWGYVVLRVDSLGGRKLKDICLGELFGEHRARDAVAAQQWLADRTYVKADSIGLFGISHGGWTALAAMGETNQPFAAVATLYPYCPPAAKLQNSPVLIMSGTNDRITPVDRCERMYVPNPEQLPYEVSKFSGLTHAFDRKGANAKFMNQPIRYNKKGTKRAVMETKVWFKRYLSD